MKKLVLDTSILIRWWHRCRGQTSSPLTRATVRGWAAQLIEQYETDAIVTPVYLEMVAGTMDRQHLQLTQAYLEAFRCIDDRRILAEDWEDAIRLAQRVPHPARPRDLGDCLIRAVAGRLNHEVKTHDKGFP